MQMRNKLMWLCGTVALFSVIGCAPKNVQTYPGAKLSKDEIAILTADRSADADVVIRRVNGVDTLRDRAPQIEVLPGTQVVRVEISKLGGSNDAYADARSINTISFEAQAGRAYGVRGKFVDGIGKVWIVDDRNAMVPVTTAAVAGALK
jgi:hypothetical protein